MRKAAHTYNHSHSHNGNNGNSNSNSNGNKSGSGVTALNSKFLARSTRKNEIIKKFSYKLYIYIYTRL